MPTEIIDKFLQEHEHKIYNYPDIPNNLINDYEISRWIENESNAPWLQIINFNPPYKEMLAEAKQLRHRFVAHRDGEQHKGWASLCIHGISAEQTQSSDKYGYIDSNAAPYMWTEIAARCPITIEFFKDIFQYTDYQRVRFMLLEPGGYINPHSDRKQSALGAAINISLNNPLGCKLVTTMGTLPFSDTGSIFMFNNHYHHVAFNDSLEDRFHIIVHGRRSRNWHSYILKSYKQALRKANSFN